MSVGLTSSYPRPDSTEITEVLVSLDLLAASPTLEVTLSLFVPALLRVLPGLLSRPLLPWFEGPGEVLLLESRVAAFFPSGFNRFGGGREARRSRGWSVELTGKVGLAAGPRDNGRDRLNAENTLKAVEG